MVRKYELRPDDFGRTGLYINDTLVISNLDEKDKNNFNREFGVIDLDLSRPSLHHKDIVPDHVVGSKPAAKRGRKLLLAQHEPLIRELIDNNPSITASDIQNILRRKGVRFSAVSAVTNLTRACGLALAG